MKTTRLKPMLCPYCGHTLDAASSVASDRRPGVGDWSVCIACAGVLRYGPDLKVQIPPRVDIDAELAEEERDGVNDGLAATIAMVKRMHREIGPPKEKGQRQ